MHKIKSLVISNWLLVIILIIASFLRLYNLTELPPGLYPDEAMNGNNAQEALDTGNFRVFYPENFGREGLFINVQALFISQFGHYPWALRLPSAIFGILTVLGLYFFTKELFKSTNNELITNKRIRKFETNSLFADENALALFSAFLLATSFWHINFSRIGFRAIMAPAFLVWSLYLLLKALKKNQKVTDNLQLITYNWIIPAAAGIIYGLGFHSYIAYRATPLLILFIFYRLYKTQYINILEYVGVSFLIFTVAATIAAAPLGIHFLKNPTDFFGRTASISIFTSETPLRDLGLNILKTAGMFNIAGDFNWRHNVAGRPLLFWPVGIMFLIGIATGLASQYFSHRMSIIWLFIALTPVVISNESLPHALRSILAAPPVFILAAIGGLKIYEFLKSKLNKTLLLATCYLLLSLFVFEAYYIYFVAWGQNPNVKPAFAYNDSVIAKYLNSLPKEVPKYVIVSDFNSKIERDNPISLQSILFLTDTFTNERRIKKNIVYVNEKDFNKSEVSQNSIILALP